MDEANKIEFQRLWDENARNEKRIDLIEQDLKELKRIALSLEKLAIQMEHMQKEQARLSGAVEKIQSSPAEEFNSAKRTVFNTILGAGVGFLITVCGSLLLFGIRNLI